MKRWKAEKIIIIVLCALLFVNVSLLIGLPVYRWLTSDKKVHIVISGNKIGDSSYIPSATSNISSQESTSSKQGEYITLYKTHMAENAPFRIGNMFPGDSKTQYYQVRISHKGPVTVEFKPEIRSGYEAFANVLKCRIVLQNSKVLYDGLLSDLTESLKHSLLSEGHVVDDLLYEVSVYLDTSVGNEYQDKELTADFEWWVTEVENLGPSPDTGDNIFWIAYAVLLMSMLVIIMLLTRRKGHEK